MDLVATRRRIDGAQKKIPVIDNVRCAIVIRRNRSLIVFGEVIL
jgi:hypothetical protein